MDILSKIEDILTDNNSSHALSTPLGRLMAEMALIDSELSLIQCNLSNYGKTDTSSCREAGDRLESIRKNVYSLRQNAITTSVNSTSQFKPKVTKYNIAQPTDTMKYGYRTIQNKGNQFGDIGIVSTDTILPSTSLKIPQKTLPKRFGFYTQDPLNNIKK